MNALLALQTAIEKLHSELDELYEQDDEMFVPDMSEINLVELQLDLLYDVMAKIDQIADETETTSRLFS